MPGKRAAYTLFCLGLALGVVASHFVPIADASRNSGGTYSLPAGNPVTSGTTISTSWANSTLTDLASEMTLSLDRNGRGAMLAPLPLSNGTNAAPSLTFGTDADTGLYRIGPNNPAFAAGSVKVWECTTTGCTFPLLMAITGAQTNAAGITATQSITNSNAFTGTGNGSGKGGAFTGGATGIGVTGTGGTTSGRGGEFTGGTTGAEGLACTATGDHHGQTCTGSTTGSGGNFVGGTTGSGVTAAAGGSATADTNSRWAIKATAGHVALQGGTPASTTAFTNTLTPSNVPKAWAYFTCVTGTCTVGAGFNVAGVTCSSSNVTVEIADNLVDNQIVPYAYIGASGTWGFDRHIDFPTINGGAVTIALYTGTSTHRDLCTGTTPFSFVLFGNQ